MKDISSSTKIYRWLFLIISLSSWKKLADSKEVRVVCYYTNWSIYRPGAAKFSPQNINPYLCTHLVYAFGGFTKENTLKPFDKYQDIEKGGYAKFTGLKTYNKNLKTLIAIGGWNEGSSRFSPMVASADRRKELVKNTIKFLRQNHFDGLDLDWEYPTFRDGGKPRDRDNYAQLVKELREEFDRESEKTGRSRLLLTMAVPAGIEYIKKGYDVPKLMKYLDWMNILSYDYHSAFEPAVNHHAPLYSLEEDSEYNYDTELNIDYTIKHYLENGAIPDKLVLGIPTYGRSYTLFNPEANEIGAPADGPGDMGEATRENGYLAYYEICDYVKNQDWEVVQPNENAMGPYAFKDNQWVGYDDEDIVRKKAEYVAKNDLGGIMYWAIDNDDFRGTCHGRPYPLIEAGKEALLTAYGMTDENLIAPPSKPTKTKSKPRTRNQKTTTTEAPEENSIATKSSARRRRIKTKQKEEDKLIPSSSSKRRKVEKGETSTYSSLKISTPSWTTPPPPATPDMGGAFKCEDEGFFPHPKDCKKYFWCLAGAGDSGIVAHQFTCPAGLYFNKAADSCDYTQNVLCNKRLQKATTTTTTESSSSSSSSSTTTSTSPRSSILSGLFSTPRVPPKITAATSRTTFVAKTTTEAPQEEYDEDEYEDEEADDKKSSEEDPRVIKELIELIRKAGGIEQLEKHLKIGDRGSESTTSSALSKTLYEKVLSKASPSTLYTIRKNTGTTRNSAGPQNQGVNNQETPNNKEKGRTQYQNISRKRPSTEKSINEEVKNEYVSEDKAEKDHVKPNRANNLEYVSIRRPKSGTSTTESSEEDSDSGRNKILGESSNEEVDVTDEKYEENTRKSNNLPQYVNIRRQRPSTTESSSVVEEKDGSTTLRYVSIRRSTTPSSIDEEQEPEASDKKTNGSPTQSGSTRDEHFKTTRYQTLSRSSTTPIPNEETIDLEESKRSTSKPEPEEGSDSKYQVIRRSTTTTTSPNPEENDISEQNVITKLDDENTLSSSTEQQPSSSPTLESINRKIEEKNNQEISSEPNKDKKRPSLFRPRPFSTGASSTTTESTSDVTKTASTSTSRPLFLVGARRRNSTLFFTTSTPRTASSTTRTTSTPTTTEVYEEHPHFIKKTENSRFSTRRPIRKNNILYASRTTPSTRFSGTNGTNTRPSVTRVTNYSRRKVNSGTTKPVESQVATTASPQRINNRFKFVSRRPFLRAQPQKKANESLLLNSDQNIEPSNQKSLEEQIRNSLETNDFTDVVHTLQSLQKTPTPIQRQPQKSRTTVTYNSSYSTSKRKIRPTTPKPVNINAEDITLTPTTEENVETTSPKNPTTPKIEISTFRRTIKPKLTFKQTPTYQEVLISQEEENESTTKSHRHIIKHKQPVINLTPSSSFKEQKTPLYYRDSIRGKESTNFNFKEPGSEYFVESTRFSKGSTPKPNLIFNEVPIIIPVLSSSYLNKPNSKNTQNNPDFTQFVYQNTNSDAFKTYEDFLPVTQVPPPNDREIYRDDVFKDLSINFPIPAGFYGSTTVRPISAVTSSGVSRGSTVTAVPFTRGEEKQITHAHVEKYSKPIKNRNRYSTTQPPFVIVTPTVRKERIQRKKGRPIQAFDKILQPAEANTFKPLAEYDYYDDLEASILGNVPEHGKVLLHSNGEIECLDQGNFPHPVSCKKFISCAKMENGKVYGWEYTCPKNLSFDPIGGICNWSAGLGCNE